MASTSTSNNKLSAPMIVLMPCSNSHPFEERRIFLTKSEESAIKIGRSVIRLQPTSDNAIFDCRVLSRNHAIIWVGEEHQFFIKDTKSSNGTFINNERLSNSGEESDAKEFFSGDILQLGVEIVDNTKKVASGCIICIVKLFDEHGRMHVHHNASSSSVIDVSESLSSPLSLNTAQRFTMVRNDKFFMLTQYAKEAKHREGLLGQKLHMLEEQLLLAQETLQTNWQSMINEERLLSRIETLEAQVAAYTTKYNNQGGEEKFRKELLDLQEDRANAEVVAKDSLRKLEEKLCESQMRLHDSENGLVNQDEENAFLRQRCREFEEEFARQRAEANAFLERFNEVHGELESLKLSNAIAVQKALDAAEAQRALDAEAQLNNSEASNVQYDFKADSQNPDAPLLNGSLTNISLGPSGRRKLDDSAHLIELIEQVIANPDEHAETIQKIREVVIGVQNTETTVKTQWIEVPPEAPIIPLGATDANGDVGTSRFVQQNHNNSNNLSGSVFSPVESAKIRSDDFQVCLLATFPILLLIFVLLMPLTQSHRFWPKNKAAKKD